MKAIITVLGKDQVGIIAGVSSLLAKWNVNVLDISQTILQENFTMVMLADLENCSLSFTELTEKLSALGAEMDIAIRMQKLVFIGQDMDREAIERDLDFCLAD